ncbi:MAG: hypothetical protein OXH09_05330 [Gammaproteobacteria bacterium]|nr:hypothetical protein [Gammaproteobacteria bacterium]
MHEPQATKARRRRRRTNAFRAAVEATPPPTSKAYRPGLQALSAAHRRQISSDDSRRLTGSIDLDAALVATQPNAPRWDYGIGYRHGRREYAVWVEVHGAQTNKVGDVLKKLHWLKGWLAGPGERLLRLTDGGAPTPAFVWLASGPIRLPPTSRHARQASQAGVFPRKELHIP